MNFDSRTPSEFWRRVIVGGVYAVPGVLAGMLLGLIPVPTIVLMVIGGLAGAWIGSQQERDP